MSDHLNKLAAVHLRQQAVLQPRLAARFESLPLPEAVATPPTEFSSDVPATEDNMSEPPAQPRLVSPALERRVPVSQSSMPQTPDTVPHAAAEVPPLPITAEQLSVSAPTPTTEIRSEPSMRSIGPEQRQGLEPNPEVPTQPFDGPDKPVTPRVTDRSVAGNHHAPDVSVASPVSHGLDNSANTVRPITSTIRRENLVEQSELDADPRTEVQPRQPQPTGPGQSDTGWLPAQMAKHQSSGMSLAPPTGSQAVVPAVLMSTPHGPVAADPPVLMSTPHSSVAADPPATGPALATLEPQTLAPVMTRPSEPAQAEPVRPTIRVTIGRIEVRAVTPPPRPQPVTQATPRSRYRPKLSLQDYLAQRHGGGR